MVVVGGAVVGGGAVVVSAVVVEIPDVVSTGVVVGDELGSLVSTIDVDGALVAVIVVWLVVSGLLKQALAKKAGSKKIRIGRANRRDNRDRFASGL